MANDFGILVGQIESANQVLQNNARVVINRHVTAKAWLTGYYIVEYEQHGVKLPHCKMTSNRLLLLNSSDFPLKM
ncbi:MAG: hypothetical protein MJZ46_00930 [Bacteroidales bacterium]|nr:hypothetical protein [Bacteroidales bacterium]